MKNPGIYGKKPFSIALIHGGPGAAGEMAAVAVKLSRDFGALEPLQTKKTISAQVKELRKLLTAKASFPVTMVGYSWGAWLSLIFAARYPGLVKKLVLVSSGPFEDKYSAGVMETRLNRLNAKEKKEAALLAKTIDNTAAGSSDKAFARFGQLMAKADSFDPVSRRAGEVQANREIFGGIWPEARALRSSGKLLALCERVKCQVTAIHGDYDAHPAEGVKAPLSEKIKSFKFILIKNCGHKPWMEKRAKDEFYEILKKEI